MEQLHYCWLVLKWSLHYYTRIDDDPVFSIASGVVLAYALFLVGFVIGFFTKWLHKSSRLSSGAYLGLLTSAAFFAASILYWKL